MGTFKGGAIALGIEILLSVSGNPEQRVLGDRGILLSVSESPEQRVLGDRGILRSVSGNPERARARARAL